MNIQRPEQLLGMQLLTTCLKKSMGDSPAFDLIMESLLQSMMNEEKENSSETKKTGESQNNSSVNNYKTNFRPQTKMDSQVKSLNNTGKNVERIENAIQKYSKMHGVDSKLVRAIIKQESDYNPKVVSSAGAMGLMQLMPENCREDGVSDPFNIEQNIEGGIKQLKNLLKMYNGNYEMALMGYNAGPGTVKRRGVHSVSDLYKMPNETRGYVKKVMGYYNSL